MNSMIALERLRAEGRAPANLDAPVTNFEQVVRGLVAEHEAEPEIPDSTRQNPTRSRTPPPAQPPGSPAPPPPITAVPEGGFENVPPSAQYPLGPYRKAPEEYGGKWWIVNPFTSAEPWKPVEMTTVASPEGEPLEATEEFLAIFGPRPGGGTELTRWEQELKYFKQSGLPEGYTEQQVEQVGALFEGWGMGRPMFFEGRYGWKTIFPGAQIAGYQSNVFATMEAPHLVIARYQIRQMQEGLQPAEFHPFVPGRFFGAEEAA